MSDLAALDAITEAVESGAGLPEVVRAAARALDASLAVTDAWGATLAVAARPVGAAFARVVRHNPAEAAKRRSV